MTNLTEQTTLHRLSLLELTHHAYQADALPIELSNQLGEAQVYIVFQIAEDLRNESTKIEY